ncbi:MAG: pilus assembly protein PilQ [Proteobacteria bacterium]|nr:MAG: pilus assembly protein PilQ [Pseudomonadota bacterium]PIE67164.1 MAG: pilus assembly protein PilQ [Deltaproteobacteria bacterium]
MGNIKKYFTKRLALIWCVVFVAAFSLWGCAAQNFGNTKSSDADTSQVAEITGISLAEGPDSVDVVIRGSRALKYSSVKQHLPLGVVLFFRDTELNSGVVDVQTSIDPVASVLATMAETTELTSRIAILLSSDSAYKVFEDGETLKIRFPKKPSQADSSDIAAIPVKSTTITEKSALPRDAGLQKPMQPVGTYQGTGARIGGENLIWVNRIDFLGESGGKSTLSIETTKKIDYQIKRISDRLLELRLMNTNIAEFRQRPMITTRFESAVNRIMPVQLPSMQNYSLFTIELRESVPYVVEQIGELLLVHFEASTVAPAPADETNLPIWKKALEESMGTPDLVAAYPSLQTSSGDMQGGGAMMDKNAGNAQSSSPVNVELEPDQALVFTKKIKKYTGEKIALDFYQTDIKNVFRILREVSGKNFAIDKDVSGKVTLTLDKPVPWDQVMDLVLRMNQLGMIVEGDIVRIATLSTLKKENDLRKSQIAALQKEKEQIKALEPLNTRYIPISYSDAKTEVLPHVQSIITKGRGSASVDSKNNQIIITDTAEKIAQAHQIARQIDKVTSQVIIEARVVEVSETYTKELGFEWNLGVGPINMFDSGSAYKTGVAMNYPAATTNGFTLNYAKIAGTPFTLDAALTALETNGKGKILSAPKIVTLNNKKAMIKQGQEIGYLERDSSGGSSVKFKDVDLLLEVTPHVTPDNRISMMIVIKKNDVTGFTEGVPVISTNEAETQLLVNDGDTIVIGGIIKSSTSSDKSAFPGLHEIPVLGWMFQRNINDVDNNELLIFMNPKIVQLEQRSGSYLN